MLRDGGRGSACAAGSERDMSENLPSKKAVLFYDRRTDLPSFVQMVLAIFGVARDSAYKPLLPPARLFFLLLAASTFRYDL